MIDGAVAALRRFGVFGVVSEPTVATFEVVSAELFSAELVEDGE